VAGALGGGEAAGVLIVVGVATGDSEASFVDSPPPMKSKPQFAQNRSSRARGAPHSEQNFGTRQRRGRI
jgi:hypothetical protein